MRILLSIPLLILLVAFALSNQQIVRVGLWPTDIMVDIPLSVAVLVAAGVFFVLGAAMTWGGTFTYKTRAKRAERAVRQLKAQVHSSQVNPAQMIAGRSGSTPLLLPPG